MSSRQMKLDKVKGENKSRLFRKEFFQLQKYGAKKARALKINEKGIEKLIFEGR